MARDTRPKQPNLFGGVDPAAVRGALRSPPAAGYPAAPGTGPEGETCGSCSHCRMRLFTRQRPGARPRKFYKCGANRWAWTHGRESDVLVHSPACRLWAPANPHVGTLGEASAP
jgi:hypothetical protein